MTLLKIFYENISGSGTLHVNGSFYVFGGSGSDYLSNIYVFTPETDQWSYLGSLLTPRDEASIIPVVNGFHVFGGKMLEKNSSEEICQFVDNGIISSVESMPRQLECRKQRELKIIPPNVNVKTFYVDADFCSR